MTAQEQSSFPNQQQQQQQWNGAQAPSNPMPPQTPAPVVQKPVQPPIQPTPVPIKSANFDLLSDIDFSMNTTAPTTPTLQPLQPVPIKSESDKSSELSVNVLQPSPAKQIEVPLSPAPVASQVIPPPTTPIDRKPSVDDISVCSDVSSIDPNFDWESASMKNEENVKITSTTDAITSKYKDAFDDPKILKWFHKEVERLEKFIETSTIKTLNGTTPLDGKWKELQDSLVKDESKRTVNVARLFPEKNRSIDSIPYDHARVSLGTPTDDYINAGYVKVSLNFFLIFYIK